MVEDLRDESDHENPVRLVLTPRSSRVDHEQLMDHLFATDAGNGFITCLAELPTRSRTGKAVLTVPNGARPLIPCPIYDLDTDWICAIHSNGNLLVFPANEVPELARGKGTRLLGIPAKKFASGEERMIALASVPEQGRLTVHAGKRHTTLRRQELEEYWSERGKRGHRLPRGFRKVESVEVEV